MAFPRLNQLIRFHAPPPHSTVGRLFAAKQRLRLATWTRGGIVQYVLVVICLDTTVLEVAGCKAVYQCRAKVYP